MMSGLGNLLNGEYLTPECKDCPDWVNDEHATGCGTHYPIDLCPAYRKAYAEKVKAQNGQEAPGY